MISFHVLNHVILSTEFKLTCYGLLNCTNNSLRDTPFLIPAIIHTISSQVLNLYYYLLNFPITLDHTKLWSGNTLSYYFSLVLQMSS